MMRPESECLAKASEMKIRAAGFADQAIRDDWLDMAECWEWLAKQAAWQDSHDRNEVAGRCD